MGKKLFCYAFLLIALAVTTPAAGPPCRDDVPLEDVLNRSLGSGIREARDFVIRNERQWCDFWDELYSVVHPSPPCDTGLFDFSEEVALVSALGSRPNTCYGVAIYCADRDGSRVRAFVRDVVPGPTCGCAMTVVNPVHVVRVAKPVAQLEFVHETAVLDCGG